jgi:hypothetical protein
MLNIGRRIIVCCLRTRKFGWRARTIKVTFSIINYLLLGLLSGFNDNLSRLKRFIRPKSQTEERERVGACFRTVPFTNTGGISGRRRAPSTARTGKQREVIG